MLATPVMCPIAGQTSVTARGRTGQRKETIRASKSAPHRFAVAVHTVPVGPVAGTADSQVGHPVKVASACGRVTHGL